MSVRLDDTTAAQVSQAISAERFRQGSSAVGRVLTLVIIADEAYQADAVRAAAEAAREHPSRIIAAIPRPGRGPARLDADVSVGGNDGLGELAVLRLRGPLSHHVASVVLPLLVPDAPVVVWWPEEAPEDPARDPVGMLAQRRITDSAASSRPLKVLDVRRQGYHAGDTDLAWTRITPWRALIASALDLPYEPIQKAAVHAQRNNPSGVLLAAWMQRGLGVPVEIHNSRGPGITGVTITTKRGEIAISRPDGRVATMTRPGFPPREAALQRRSLEGLIAEELRRLDPDEIYGETLQALPELAGFATHGSGPAPKVADPDPAGPTVTMAPRGDGTDVRGDSQASSVEADREARARAGKGATTGGSTARKASAASSKAPAASSKAPAASSKAPAASSKAPAAKPRKAAATKASAAKPSKAGRS